MPKGNGQNNNEEEKDIETVSVNNSEADEEEEKTEEQIDNEEDIDNDNDDGDGDEKMTAKEAKDNFVETARNIALSGSFDRLLADAKGSTPWEVALNIQKKAMKNKGAQIYNDYMKISNKMENELKSRPSEVGKKTEIVKQDNSLKKLN